MYRVYDTCGEPLRQRFSNRASAEGFIALMGRAGEWEAREVKSFNHYNYESN